MTTKGLTTICSLSTQGPLPSSPQDAQVQLLCPFVKNLHKNAKNGVHFFIISFFFIVN